MASKKIQSSHCLRVTSQALKFTKADFQLIIQHIISDHTPSNDTEINRIDLVLLVNGIANEARSQIFSKFQKMIADTYTLVCVIAAEQKKDLDFPGGLDIRLYAVDVDNSPSTTFASVSGPLTRLDIVQNLGPISGLKHELLLGLNRVVIDKVVESSTARASIHHKVAVGGTFDHLHIGHKLLLTMTIFAAQPGPEDREITVGITGDELLVNKKHASVLESWDVRQQRSADFVESILVFHPDVASIRTIEHVDRPEPNGKVVKVSYQAEGNGKVTINYTRISDPFGPTITDESITALVISAETRAGGKAVNDKRNEKGWASLEVFEVDVLDPASVSNDDQAAPTKTSSDFATKISSTEIRRRLANTPTS